MQVTGISVVPKDGMSGKIYDGFLLETERLRDVVRWGHIATNSR